MGSIIYDGSTFHKIPAYIPKEVVNATGAGDTYMTGYLYKRAKGASIEEAGRFRGSYDNIEIEGIGHSTALRRCVAMFRDSGTTNA